VAATASRSFWAASVARSWSRGKSFRRSSTITPSPANNRTRVLGLKSAGTSETGLGDVFGNFLLGSHGSGAPASVPGPDGYAARRDRELRKTISEIEAEAKAERQRKRDRPVRVRRFEV
jgi:hypothetical protein